MRELIGGGLQSTHRPAPPLQVRKGKEELYAFSESSGRVHQAQSRGTGRASPEVRHPGANKGLGEMNRISSRRSRHGSRQPRRLLAGGTVDSRGGGGPHLSPPDSMGTRWTPPAKFIERNSPYVEEPWTSEGGGVGRPPLAGPVSVGWSRCQCAGGRESSQRPPRRSIYFLPQQLPQLQTNHTMEIPGLPTSGVPGWRRTAEEEPCRACPGRFRSATRLTWLFSTSSSRTPPGLLPPDTIARRNTTPPFRVRIQPEPARSSLPLPTAPPPPGLSTRQRGRHCVAQKKKAPRAGRLGRNAATWAIHGGAQQSSSNQGAPRVARRPIRGRIPRAEQKRTKGSGMA